MAKTDRLTVSNTIRNEYLSLLSSMDTSAISNIVSYNTKYRSPITEFDYKDDYTVITYKISDSINESLPKLMDLKRKNSEDKVNIMYSYVGADRFTLDYSNDTTNRIDKIILNLSGDSLQIRVSGDTLVNYYLRFKQISWSNGPDRKLDVYIEPRGFLCIPADIAFIKRQNKLYFILVSINGDHKYLDPHLLDNLMSK